MDIEDRKLLTAHDDLLVRAVDFLRNPKLDPRSPGQFVILGLGARVLQLAHALQALCEAGHAGEGAALARSILSGTASLVAICDDDREARAFAYVQGGRLTKSRIDGAARELGLHHEELSEFVRKLADASTAGERQFVDAGVVAKRLGNDRSDTWHGWSDQRLFEEMKMSSWYELSYRTFSDESHVSARAVTQEVREFTRRDVGFGSKFGPCWEVVLPSGRCVAKVLAQLNIVFEVDERDAVQGVSRPFEDALRAYKHYDHVT